MRSTVPGEPGDIESVMRRKLKDFPRNQVSFRNGRLPVLVQSVPVHGFPLAILTGGGVFGEGETLYALTLDTMNHENFA